jgi:tetratricopeptide (TPR) repeat protein
VTVWRALGEGDQLVAVRMHRKIVQVITELKWTVSLEQLQQANAARLISRSMLIDALPGLTAAQPHVETVRALITLSTDAWRIQDPPDWMAAQAFAQTAVDMAAQLDSPVDQSQALGALATVLDGRSLLREHLAVTQQRLELCRSPRFEVPESIEAVRGAAAALMYVGEYEQALRGLEEAEQLAVRAQLVEQQANALGLQAQCNYRLDRWDEVLATEVKWRELERKYPRERVGEMCFFVGLSASVYALRGDGERAEAYAKESYDFMVYVSGTPDQWQRNQFY